jgi:hypothetical protein
MDALPCSIGMILGNDWISKHKLTLTPHRLEIRFTGESGPVKTDRPKPAVSHEVPGRVERPGPVTPPVGLEGARARPLWRGGVCERADSSTTTCAARVARRATRSARRSRRAFLKKTKNGYYSR